MKLIPLQLSLGGAVLGLALCGLGANGFWGFVVGLGIGVFLVGLICAVFLVMEGND